MISVDFISLENQIKRLEEYLRFIENINDEAACVFRQLEDMELGEAEDELRYGLNILREASETLADNILKLKRITELYSECEADILSDISDLPLNIPFQFASEVLKDDPVLTHAAAQLKTDVYSGHTIINDQWLDDIIFGTEE